MKKRLFLTAILFLTITTIWSQETKVAYDETINPIEQIDQAIKEAKTQNKNVICQVGGNWCPWCLRLISHISNDTVVEKFITDNYIYIHVNYHPRKQTTEAEALMQRLGNPARFGFPVLVVLNNDGNVIHIQDSSFLEEGNGYNSNKILRFLKNWTVSAHK